MVNHSTVDLNLIFAALADPVRRNVTEALVTGEKTLSQLAAPFKMTMAAVMKHVRVLERSGLVRTEKRGRTRYCRLETEKMNEARAWLEKTAMDWTTRLTALERYLEEESAD